MNGNQAARMENLMGEAAQKARVAATEQQAAESFRLQKLTSAMTPEQHAMMLQRVRPVLIESFDFKVGDLIMAKQDLNDFQFPAPGYPIIIHEILKEPIVDTKIDVTNSRYGRKYDMVALGVHNGQVIPFHIESSRYRPFEPPKTA